jgi:hypothetical protein
MSGGDFLSFSGYYPKNMFLSGAVWSEITGAVCSEFTGAVCSVIVTLALGRVYGRNNEESGQYEGGSD